MLLRCPRFLALVAALSAAVLPPPTGGARHLREQALIPSSTKLPLRYLPETGTYGLGLRLDGANQLTQVGTLGSDLWVDCTRFKDGASCASTCATILTTEVGELCATEAAADVRLTDAPEILDLKAMPIAIRQHIKTDGSSRNTEGAVVTAAAGGLGLGRVSLRRQSEGHESTPPFITAFSSFSVVAGKSDASFLMLNGVDNAYMDKNGLSAVRLPLRPPSDGEAPATGSWAVRVLGLQTNDNQIIRTRSADGGDAPALLSLGHSAVVLPTSVFKAFADMYLPGEQCNRRGDQYVCKAAITAALPRLAVYLQDHVFYLQPSDYTRPDPASPSSDVLIDVLPRRDALTEVLLGAPFFRAFPVTFKNGPTGGVQVFCAAGRNCDANTAAVNHLLQDNGGLSDGSSGPSQRGSPVEVLVPVAISAAVFVGVVLRVLYRRQERQRRRALEETATVASDWDLEEANERLRELSQLSAEDSGECEDTTGFARVASPVAASATPAVDAGTGGNTKTQAL